MRNLNARAAVHLLNARMGFVFALSITMEMDIIAHVSCSVNVKRVGEIE